MLGLRKYSGLYCLFLLLFLAAHGQAQEQLFFERIEREDGTQLGHVFRIFEDREGFVWLCSNRGLARYDGYSFKFYHARSGDPTTPTSSWTYFGMQDSKGRIWTGTNRGLNIMDRRSETFKRFTSIKGDSTSLPHQRVRFVHEDGEGRFWVGTWGGACLYNEEKENFQRLDIPGYKGGRHSANFFEDRRGRLWLTSEQGLYRIDQEKLSGTQVLPEDEPGISAFALNTRHIFEGPDSLLWVSTGDGIWKYDPQTGDYRQMPLPEDLRNNSCGELLEYPKGYLMIGSFEVGLLSWDLKNDRLHKGYASSPYDLNGPTVNSIYCMAPDSRGNLWIGLFNGANKVKLKGDHFRLYKNVPGTYDLRNYTLRTYGDPQGGIWVNSMRGVFYRPGLDQPAEAIVGGVLGENQYHGIGNFSMDPEGRLWFGMRRDGIYQYDPKRKITSRIEALPPNPDIGVPYILADEHTPGLIWTTTTLGIFRYDYRSGEGRWLYPKEQLPHLPNNNTDKLVQDTSGYIWISRSPGLLRLDPRTETFKQYPFPEGDSTLSTYALRPWITRGQLWAATSNSLNHYLPDEDRFETFTKADGLPPGRIISMSPGDKGDFWLGQNGVTRYLPAEQSSQNFNTNYKADGLIIGYCGKAADGSLLFPSSSGMLAFHPDSVQIDSQPPRVVLLGIKVDNEPLTTSVAPVFLDSLTLSWDSRLISFEYAGLKYEKMRGIRYRIMLEGFDQDWREMGNKRDATYTNLNPGNYRFLIEAANADGVWTAEPRVLHLRILPPYWQTSWFYLLVAMLVLAVLYIIFRYYQYAQQLSRQKEVAEQSARYKSLFLANMSHEIRTPMNAIVGMSKLMFDTELNSKQREYADIIRQAAENLLVIINDILDHSRIESGKYSIQHKAFELDILLRQLYKIFEIRAREKGLDFSTHIRPGTPLYLRGDATRLNQILMNLTGNAIKFTREGQVSLEVRTQEEADKQTTLLFAIRDTGPGIPEEKQEAIFESFERVMESGELQHSGTGLGLAIARQLVEQQGGRIWLDSRKGQGTTFFFSLSFEKIQTPRPAQPPAIPPDSLPNSAAILLVEDTLFNQQLALELIRKFLPQAEVELANNGQVALEKLARKNYDLILMDVKMPVMDGFEATRKIRALKDKQKCCMPIIAVTANAIPEQLEECRKAGMNDYVTKPINGEELYAKILKHLRR
jgi:signal transduction histidine kinase/ligand-binding sensor domain-containing protein/CheY-like chemotaxis protein